jgi:hypothetical protein
MLAALLMGLLFFSGGGFTAKIFGKDTQAVVREVVSDPARVEVAMQTLKHGNEDLKPITKQLDKIAKFQQADEAQSPDSTLTRSCSRPRATADRAVQLRPFVRARQTPRRRRSKVFAKVR